MADDNHSHSERLVAAKAYYLFTFTCTAFVVPFFNLYFKQLGFSAATIGLLSALRPWVSATSGSVWAAAADSAEGHRSMMLLCYVLSTATRSAISLVHTFWPLLALVVATEAFSSPVSVIADTVIAAACAEGGNYGAQRMYGAIGWGSMSLVAGIVISHYGIYAGFTCYAVVAVVSVVPLLLLSMDVLQSKEAQSQLTARPTAAIAIAASAGDAANAAVLLGGVPGLEAAPTHQVLPSAAPVPTNSRLAATSNAPSQPPSGQQMPHGQRLPKLLRPRSAPAQWYRKQTEWDAEAAAPEAPEPPTVPPTESGSSLAGSSSEDAGSISDSESDKVALTSLAMHLPVPPMIIEPALWVVHPSGVMAKVPLTVLESRGSAEAPLLTVDREDLENAIHGRRVRQARHDGPKKKPSLRAGAASLLTNQDVMIFFVMVTLMGFAKGVVDSFLFIFIDELGGSEMLMGYTLFAMCVAEVPVFFYTGALLKRVGIDVVLHVVLGCLVLRSLAYTAMPRFAGPWFAAPIEFVGGAVFSCAWAAGISNCTRIAPKGMQATVQAIYQGLFTGVGAGLGALIGGYVYSRYSAQVMFAMAGIAVSVGWLLTVVGQMCHRLRKPRNVSDAEQPLLGNAA